MRAWSGVCNVRPMSPRHPIVVTIDGPAGAGKSTVAKTLARSLDYRMLDTGAIYRTVALLAGEREVSWTDEDALFDICAGLPIQFRMEGMVNHVLLGDDSGAGERDITTAIRAPEISRGASEVSGWPRVRDGLLNLQRRLGADGGVVVEGRDTGTVVFPDAGAKFFLTASAEVRATRRHDELSARGVASSRADILSEIVARDARDSNRAVAPLTRAEDAILVDSSERTIEEVVGSMLEIVKQREQIEV